MTYILHASAYVATRTSTNHHAWPMDRHYIHVPTKARFPLPEFTARVHGPWTRVHFLTPELTARVDGVQKMHPSWRPVNSACQLGPWTRVVETGLKSLNTSRASNTSRGSELIVRIEAGPQYESWLNWWVYFVLSKRFVYCLLSETQLFWLTCWLPSVCCVMQTY